MTSTTQPTQQARALAAAPSPSIALLLLLIPTVVFGGCKTDRGRTVGQATGAGTLIGAAAGAAVGYAAGKGKGAAWGAAIGAAAGAGTGYVVGSNTADDKAEYLAQEEQLQTDIAMAQSRQAAASQEVAALHGELDRIEQEFRALTVAKESTDMQRAQLEAQRNQLNRSIDSTRSLIAQAEVDITNQRARKDQYPADWALRQTLEDEIRKLENHKRELDSSLSRALALRSQYPQP